MKLLIKVCFIAAFAVLFFSCKNNSKAPSHNATITNDSKINGVWVSINDRIVNKIEITQSDSINFIFETTFVDGGIGKKKILFEGGKYLTNNKFGEYYKLIDDKLGYYDEEGLISNFRK